MIDNPKTERALFNDKEIEKQFSENGYVQLPLFKKSVIESLRQIYAEQESHSNDLHLSKRAKGINCVI